MHAMISLLIGCDQYNVRVPCPQLRSYSRKVNEVWYDFSVVCKGALIHRLLEESATCKTILYNTCVCGVIRKELGTLILEGFVSNKMTHQGS